MYLLESGVKEADKLGIHKFCVLYDREGYISSNFNVKRISYYKPRLEILADCFTERITHLYVLHSNWFFKLVF